MCVWGSLQGWQDGRRKKKNAYNDCGSQQTPERALRPSPPTNKHPPLRCLYELSNILGHCNFIAQPPKPFCNDVLAFVENCVLTAVLPIPEMGRVVTGERPRGPGYCAREGVDSGCVHAEWGDLRAKQRASHPTCAGEGSAPF